MIIFVYLCHDGWAGPFGLDCMAIVGKILGMVGERKKRVLILRALYTRDEHAPPDGQVSFVANSLTTTNSMRPLHQYAKHE